MGVEVAAVRMEPECDAGHALDNAKLVAFLGTEPHTPIDVAVRSTLEGLGCMPAGVSPRRPR